MSVWAVVQARLGSSRLPGKVLAPVAGRPLLDWVLDRAARAVELAGVAVVVPDGDTDAPLREWLAARGATWFAGSEEDVLDRYYRAALELAADDVVRLSGDNPFVDPALIDELVHRYLGTRADYGLLATGWASAPPGVKRYPHGVDVEIVSAAALETAWRETADAADREHVTRFFWRQPDRYRIVTLGAPQEWGEQRWTVDDQRDLVFADEVARRLVDTPEFGYEDLLELLDHEPTLRNLDRSPPPRSKPS